jgi:hypothetical protein
VAQLAAPRLRLALREPGSGARAQLLRLLEREGVSLDQLLPRALPVHNHMEVA